MYVCVWKLNKLNTMNIIKFENIKFKVIIDMTQHKKLISTKVKRWIINDIGIGQKIKSAYHFSRPLATGEKCQI